MPISAPAARAIFGDDAIADEVDPGMTLANKTIFITGGSRGIGLAIALRAARDVGLAEELRADCIACNALWPQTTIATAAVEFALGGEAMMRRSRRPG